MSIRLLMNIELEKALCRDFPATYARLAQRRIYDVGELLKSDLRSYAHITSFGIEHGDGWYGLSRRFAEIAEPFCLKTGSYVKQQKEKYGALVIYLSGYNDEVDAAIAAAEDASETVCEQCGAPAKISESAGWVSTVCADCGSPAMSYFNRRAHVERILHYIIEPRWPNQVDQWRELLVKRINRHDEQ